jgi:hypothetical protein
LKRFSAIGLRFRGRPADDLLHLGYSLAAHVVAALLQRLNRFAAKLGCLGRDFLTEFQQPLAHLVQFAHVLNMALGPGNCIGSLGAAGGVYVSN